MKKISMFSENCLFRPKKELVTFRLEKDVNPLEKTGTYLKPKELAENDG